MTAKAKLWRSGFCGIDNPPDSHARCSVAAGDLTCICICHTLTAPPTNPLDAITTTVEALAKAVPGFLAACTDPEGLDVAELLLTIVEARKALQAVEREVELAAAKALLTDETEGAGLYVERYRSTDRKAWDHADWQRDVRAKVLQAHGLKGAQGVLTADGEVLPADVLYDALAAVQSAHGAAAPKTTTLKGFGLDARDYCESSPGAWHVKVSRRVETETTEGETDAA